MRTEWRGRSKVVAKISLGLSLVSIDRKDEKVAEVLAVLEEVRTRSRIESS